MPLIKDTNLPDPDAAYRMIVEAHRGLSDEQSAMLDSALVLILVNHIGDMDVLREALSLALPAATRGANGRNRKA